MEEDEEGLFELLDRSIDPPGAGVVNFRSLRDLLHSMLQWLCDLKAEQLQEASETTGQEEDSEEKESKCMSLIEDLMKENQELKEKSSNLEKEVAMIHNLINKYVAMEDMQGIFDAEKQKMMEELNDRISGIGLPDASAGIKYDRLEARVLGLEDGQENILDRVNQLKTQLMENEEFAKSVARDSQSKQIVSRPEPQPQPHLQTADLRNAVQRLDDELQNVKQDLLRIEQRGSPEPEIEEEPPEEEDEEPPWLPGMEDLSMKMSEVFERYENLQSLVNGLMTQKTIDTTSQATETTQTQEIVTYIPVPQPTSDDWAPVGPLITEEHIEDLYKTVKELDERKADKAALEIGKNIESNIQALENKVIVCDTNTVELKKELHDLHTSLTDHEENCQKVTEKIFSELDTKVNLYELDPLKKQLRLCQTKIRKQTQADSDSAAAVKTQLKTRFTCLSCDRPVYMVTPGPCWPSIPKLRNITSPKHQRLRPVPSLFQCELLPTKKSMEQFTVFRKNEVCSVEEHVCKGPGVENNTLWFPEDSLPLVVKSQMQVSLALSDTKHPPNEGHTEVEASQ